MRNFRALLIVLLALLWLPASMHCRLEVLPGLDFLACASAAGNPEAGHQESDCTKDACANLESGNWRQPESIQPPVVLTWPAELMMPDLAAELARVDLPGGPVASLSPPDFSRYWQFSHRTALPPRAPSPVA